MTPVRAHERAAPRKPEAYINTHMALFSRRTDAIRFAQRHGVEIEAETPKQSNARQTLADITAQLAALAKLAAKIGRGA